MVALWWLYRCFFLYRGFLYQFQLLLNFLNKFVLYFLVKALLLLEIDSSVEVYLDFHHTCRQLVVLKVEHMLLSMVWGPMILML